MRNEAKQPIQELKEGENRSGIFTNCWWASMDREANWFISLLEHGLELARMLDGSPHARKLL
ncbi:hypothetical protein TorRG33x02_221880, partial [Trema orientale]